jgi:hypothetical protein
VTLSVAAVVISRKGHSLATWYREAVTALMAQYERTADSDLSLSAT